MLNTKKKTGCLAIFCFPAVSHVAVETKLDKANAGIVCLRPDVIFVFHNVASGRRRGGGG